MGLIEMRTTERLQSQTLPKYQDELRQITGSALTYNVDWDSFAHDINAMENLEENCLKPLNEIFRGITKDAIGKEAVAKSIKEIHLSQSEGANIQQFALTSGALVLPWDWSGWPKSFYPDTVQEKIESLL